MFEFIFSLANKMTFVSKGMGQISGGKIEFAM